ncbi:hypothetical protein DL89DRAFT_76058 [Linderina pennispora]|uniref:Uncharacterized protein n=1 Tax=Linderina pennispora TaxID=61395 RepID=A0A1Y1VXP6_9FUNG|nr:uncharacterized protein DL89DRAFT_76058 [Linderina pennispora]ORX66052.1 hypothetical protein DL89DRAFT_76058 [Linderina pennispora]
MDEPYSPQYVELSYQHWLAPFLVAQRRRTIRLLPPERKNSIWCMWRGGSEKRKTHVLMARLFIDIDHSQWGRKSTSGQLFSLHIYHSEHSWKYRARVASGLCAACICTSHQGSATVYCPSKLNRVAQRLRRFQWPFGNACAGLLRLWHPSTRNRRSIALRLLHWQGEMAELCWRIKSPRFADYLGAVGSGTCQTQGCMFAYTMSGPLPSSSPSPE